MFSHIWLACCLPATFCAVIFAAPSQLVSKDSGNRPVESKAPARADEAELAYQQFRELTKNAMYAAAHAKLFQAVALWEQAGQSDRATRTLLETAERYAKAGRWQDALSCYGLALKSRALPDKARAGVLVSTASLYSRLRQFDLALSHYRQSLGLAQKASDPSTGAMAMIGIAGAYAGMGHFHEAAVQLEKARAIKLPEVERKLEAALIRLSAQVYLAEARKADACKALEQVIALYQKDGAGKEDIALLLCDLSHLYLTLDDLTPDKKNTALDYARRARDIADGFENDELRWRAWLALARAERAIGQPDNAVKSYYRAYTLLEKQAMNFSTDALKIGFLEERQEPYRELTDLLIKMNRYEDSYKVYEHLRSRVALDFLSQDSPRQYTTEQRRALNQSAQAIARLQTDLRSAKLNGGQRATLQSEMERAELRRKELLVEAQMNGLDQFTMPASIKQVREALHSSGEALIEFLLGPDCSYAWVITRAGIDVVKLPGRNEIEDSVRRYLEVITSKPTNRYLEHELSKVNRLGDELFTTLLGGMTGQLAAARRLIIVPDGLLYYLPFETLSRAGRYLIEDHAINYFPSGSIFRLFREAKGNLKPADQMELLAFGDPVFKLPATASAEAAAGASIDKPQTSPLSEYGLPPLPGTRDEVQSISELFPAERVRVFLGESATEDALKSQPLGHYRFLHIASHGLLNEGSPTRSGILFTFDNDPAEDGFLGVEEIADLNMSGCEMVVLSACQTGRGQLVGGEGLIGVARAFLFAGAKSVTVSLWAVSDFSTAAFMKRFYRYVADKVAIVESLRLTKLDMLKSQKAQRHPFYWAPFIIVGGSE